MTFTDPEGFDTIVMLETIEHVSDPRAFIANLVSLLKPGGRMIASVPFTPTVDANPYHLHDFTVASLSRLFRPHGLKRGSALCQVQPFGLVKTVIKREDPRSRDIRRNLPAHYLRHPWALAKRIYSTLRYGFTNRYITVVWTRE
jgi:SAM-dependent methyltransferase